MKLHDRLGVDKNASQDDVRRAYRRRSKKEHPDAGGDPEAFKELTGAYLVLRDPARRAHYEATGDENAAGADSTREQALQILAQAISQTLTDQRAGSVDFVKIIRDNLKHMNVEVTKQKAELDRRRDQVERNAKRWKQRGDGPDVLAQITAAALRDIETAKYSADQKLAVHAAAIEILDGYEYEHTAAPQYPSPTLEGLLSGSFTSTRGAW